MRSIPWRKVLGRAGLRTILVIFGGAVVVGRLHEKLWVRLVTVAVAFVFFVLWELGEVLVHRWREARRGSKAA